MSYLFSSSQDVNISQVLNAGFESDFSSIKSGEQFPPTSSIARNRAYRANMSYYSGAYASGKTLNAWVDRCLKPINYKVLSLNYFRLIVDKLVSLLFSNPVTIQTGDDERDAIIRRLVSHTGWFSSIQEAVRLCEIYGDACLKTYKGGASAFAPLYAYKVVNSSDVDQVEAYVLREILYANGVTKPATHIRILISCKGFDYERVFEYNGDDVSGVLGKPVRFKYKDRWIPKKGRYYWSELDVPTVQWLITNPLKSRVYGSSSFESIKDIVFAIETRLSTENWVINAHGAPLLIAGMSAFTTDETTGGYKLSVIDGKYIVDKGSDIEPHYLTWDGKLDASKQVREDLMSAFYELSEMGRTFLSGEYTGNVSEESLNNIIKSAIDRGMREVSYFLPMIQESLYVLCRLNEIDVSLEDINISFNIGRADDSKVLADTCQILSSIGLFSNKTLLKKFWGYSDADAIVEAELVSEQSKEVNDDNNGIS